jgi:hypothetical protein
MIRISGQRSSDLHPKLIISIMSVDPLPGEVCKLFAMLNGERAASHVPGEVIEEELYIVNGFEVWDVDKSLNELLGGESTELGVQIRHQVAGGGDPAFCGCIRVGNNIR